ncbi:LCP family protein [Streptomyces sp. 135]|uniref:LCP family protein n=1 Tax=Streptomyces sp. 135 TaxID=2838850 RepID=UPI001CBCC5D8|nr:LCP family protein [Streptomyces sp. 135]
MGTKTTRGQRIRRTLLAVVVGLVLVVTGSGLWAYHHLNGNLHGVDIDGALGTDRPKDMVTGDQNFVMLGSDSRSGKNGDLAGGDTSGTARADTAIVVHVPADHHQRATAVSIPRDTLVTRPSCGTLPAATRVMFNSIYQRGGPACVVKTVESMSGIRMDHYLEVDFAGFKRLVDVLGGVTVTTDRRIDDSGSGLHLAAGTHNLKGDTALAFVRTRHGIGDGSDLGRIELQQKFILAALHKIQTEGTLTNPAKLYKVADAATKALTTDDHLASLLSLTSFARGLDALNPSTMDLRTLPVKLDVRDPNRVVALDSQANILWKALRTDTAVPRSVKNGL